MLNDVPLALPSRPFFALPVLSRRYSGGLWRNAAALGPLTAAQADLEKLKMGWGNGDPRGVGGLFHLDQYISSLGKFCLSYSLDLEEDAKTKAVVR